MTHLPKVSKKEIDELDKLALGNFIKTKEESPVSFHNLSEHNATSGTPQLDTLAPFSTWLIKEQGFSPQDISRILSYNPGKFVKKFPILTDDKYGLIDEGYRGIFTVIDTNKPITIKKEHLKTKCAWSPFEGYTFPR